MIDVELIDSDILLYSIDNSHPEKKAIVKKIITDCFLGMKKRAISTQNISEFFVNSIKKTKSSITFEESKKIVKGIVLCDDLIKLHIKEETILSAIEIAEKYKISYWDAQIIAVMKENGISTILTENTKDFNVPGIVAVNPFNN